MVKIKKKSSILEPQANYSVASQIVFIEKYLNLELLTFVNVANGADFIMRRFALILRFPAAPTLRDTSARVSLPGSSTNGASAIGCAARICRPFEARRAPPGSGLPRRARFVGCRVEPGSGVGLNGTWQAAFGSASRGEDILLESRPDKLYRPPGGDEWRNESRRAARRPKA